MTPRSFWLSTLSRFTPYRVNMYLIASRILSTLHFIALKFIYQIFWHDENSFKSPWRMSQSLIVIICRYSLVSSAKSFGVDDAMLGRSFTKMRKSKGPNIENSKWVWSGNTTITNPHRKEEPLNHHDTPGRQIKQSNQLSLPKQDDCDTRMDIQLRTTKHRIITGSHNGNNNKQKVNNNRTIALERTAAYATGGLKCILLVPNLCPRFCCCWSTRNVQLAWRPSN